MSHYPSRRILRVLPIFFFAVAPVAQAQTKSGNPPAERGWGSAWQEPATEQQRKQQAVMGKIQAAQRAHHASEELSLSDQLAVLSPGSPGPDVIRAHAHDQLKQFDRALTDLDHAQALAQKEKRPDISAHVLSMRARVHEHQHDYGAAVNDLQVSLKLDDKNQDAFNNLAWLRATAPDAAFRNGTEGIRLAQRAVALAGDHSYVAIDTLAAAYAEANDFGRAADSEKRAMTTAEKEIKDTAKAQKFRQDASERLRLFELHQAYHADLP